MIADVGCGILSSQQDNYQTCQPPFLFKQETLSHRRQAPRPVGRGVCLLSFLFANFFANKKDKRMPAASVAAASSPLALLAQRERNPSTGYPRARVTRARLHGANHVYRDLRHIEDSSCADAKHLLPMAAGRSGSHRVRKRLRKVQIGIQLKNITNRIILNG